MGKDIKVQVGQRVASLMRNPQVVEISLLGNINYIRFVYKDGKMDKFSFTDEQGDHEGEINEYVSKMYVHVQKQNKMGFEEGILLFSEDPFTKHWKMKIIKH